MASIGLRNFRYAYMNDDGETYKTPETLGGAIECKVGLDIAEAELYSDDKLKEKVTSFKKGTLTLGIDDDDDKIFASLLGEKSSMIPMFDPNNPNYDPNWFQNQTNNDPMNPNPNPMIPNYDPMNPENDYTEYTSGSEDISAYVGFGQVVPKMINGIRKYKVEWFPKVQFKPYVTDKKTKGDNLEFTTPSVEGTVFENNKKEWRKRATFNTEFEAQLYLDSLFYQMM